MSGQFKIGEVPTLAIDPPAYIYGLRDPSTQQIRYVGITTSPTHRKAQHWTDRKSGTLRGQWLRSLHAVGMRPEFVILEVTTAAEGLEAETRWIRDLSSHGHMLVNEQKLPAQSESEETPTLEGFITAKEAATLIGIHRNNVLKAVRLGWLPGIRLFGRVIIRKVDAEAYKARAKKSRPPPAP